MSDPSEPGPLPGLPVRLTATEQIVLERLEHEERDAERPRLARTYRRLIELSRSDEISTTSPGAAGRALRLLVDGDEWRSLPHVAAEPLRSALQKLMASGDPDARAEAKATIHILGAQGFLEYRDLLDLGDSPTGS